VELPYSLAFRQRGACNTTLLRLLSPQATQQSQRKDRSGAKCVLCVECRPGFNDRQTAEWVVITLS